MSEFGDWEPLDSYCPGEADPWHVARRIHEVRMLLEEQAGRVGIVGWYDLNEDEQLIATTIAAHLLEDLREDTTGQTTAIALHEARCAFDQCPLWNELKPDEQHLSLFLGEYLINWLRIEGSLSSATST